MRLFNAIAIETGSRCTRKCWFCPVAYNPRPNEWMDSHLISNIIEQLADLKYTGRIELYMYNEPYLDSRMKDIVYMCRKTIPKACIMFATNTDMIKSWEQFQEMYDAGVNQIQANIYSNVPRWREVRKMLAQTDAVEGTNMFTAISSKKREYTVEQKYDRKITPSSPKVGNFKLANRSGLIPSLPVPDKPLKKMCVRPFRSMQINWKGEVVLCCNDNRADVVCGNVNTDSIQNIWENSRVFKKYRKKLLKNKRKGLKFCKTCDFDGGAYPHMIAKFWPELVGDK